MSQALTTCLWFDGNAKEAAEFYCSVFKDSRITSENPIVVSFELNGSRFLALNGGPAFKFNESISQVIHCSTQEEIDHYWNALSKGGEEGRCGWLKDKYGLSWQVVPSQLGRWMSNPATVGKVSEAFMKMNKFILAELEAAAKN